MSYITTNNAFSTLAGGITALDTNITLASGTGDRFPVIIAPDFSYITFENAAGSIEIVKLVGRVAASDTLSIFRAQDNTTAKAWATGDIVELRVIALLLNSAIAHPTLIANAHQASAIGFTPSGSIAANNVQAAIAELETEIYGVTAGLLTSINNNTTNLNNHIANSSAHTAANLANVPAGNIVSTNVQSAITELDAYAHSLQGNQTQYALTTGTADAYEMTPITPITSYNDQQILKIRFDQPCNPNATLRVSGVNPPLDIKIATSKGLRVNVGIGDIITNHVTLGLIVDNGTAILIEAAVNAVTRVGSIEKYAGINIPFGRLACPLVPTDISRITYSELFSFLVTNSGYTPQTITSITNASPAVFTKIAHGFLGSELIRFSTTGVLPTGLVSTQDYYVTIIDSNTFKVSSSLANYLAGTFVATTSAGSGTHSWLQSTWGLGDGATTFGMPFFPADYTDVQSNANVGTITVGAVIAHAHAIYGGGGGGATMANTQPVLGAISGGTVYTGVVQSSGGTANLAAGMRVQYCVCYRD